MIFHTFHWTIAIHHDLVDCKIAASLTRESITHRLLGIQMLRSLLAKDMSHDEVELAVLTVMSIALTELDQQVMDDMFSAAPLPFEPPMQTNDFNIQSRPRRDPRHGEIMAHLIRRLGSWDRVKLPGLASSLAMYDTLLSAEIMPGR